MKIWSDFYDHLLPDVPGCPYAMLDHALRQAAIAFCEQSLAWRQEHPDIAIIAPQAKYLFDPPAESVVHVITYAALDGRQISTETQASDMRINEWRNQSGRPQYVLGQESGLRLVPRPDADGTLSLEVALKPVPLAASVPDLLFDEWREPIIHGALSRLMLSPKKPYSNSQLAQYHQQQAHIKTGQAGIRVARDRTRAPLQTSIMRRH